jgi:two-component system, cell cycle response regulator DivK
MKPRVLLVEDNEQNRYLANFLLTQAGAEVLFAANGLEGVQMARAEKPDVIVMDIQMPEMDGYEAARQLRADPATRHIPIVAATSYAMVGDRDKAMKIGMTDYIEKPYDPETFVARVLSFVPRPPTSG